MRLILLLWGVKGFAVVWLRARGRDYKEGGREGGRKEKLNF